MSYQRFLKPAFFPSYLPFLATRGTPLSGVVNLQVGTLNTGSSVYDLFDGRALERVSIDCGGSGTDLLIRFDFGATTNPAFNFIAILNHNFNTADVAEIQVRHHTSAFTAVSDGTAVTLTTKVGGVSGGSYVADGDTISVFTEVSDKRYWAIVIPNAGIAFAADVEIGQILLGRSHTASAGPDVASIRRDLLFDGVELEQSLGGQTYGNAAFVAPQGGTSASQGQPFHSQGIAQVLRAGGRRRIKYRQHFMLDTETHKDDISSATRGTSFEENVQQITCGELHPLVWVPDSASGTVGDYMWCRLAVGGKDQVAHNVVSYDLTVTEEY